MEATQTEAQQKLRQKKGLLEISPSAKVLTGLYYRSVTTTESVSFLDFCCLEIVC